MSGANLAWGLAFGLPVLALHLVSVTLTRALRTYSRSRLEELCARRRRPGRADDVAHHDERTERAAETLAVFTGLLLAAGLGLAADRAAPSFSGGTVPAIALGVGAAGYVLAGVVGRVFAERVIDALWPAALPLRLATAPLTFATRLVELLVERLAGLGEEPPRPTSVEVEIPADSLDPEDAEPDLPESTRELVQHAVELTQRDVAELMTPRSRMVMLPATVTPAAAASTFHETGKSRIPVYGENHDDIVGVLYAKDLFPALASADDPDSVVPRKLVRKPYCVPDSKNAFDLLEEFRAHRTHFAVVLDEYGGVSGLITLEDLLEELVGPIDDEHDGPSPPDPVVPLGGSRFEVDAALTVEELNERLGLRLPTDGDFQTVGGLAFHALGRVPEPGVTFRYDGIEVSIVAIADHAIRRLRLDLQPAAAVGSG